MLHIDMADSSRVIGVTLRSHICHSAISLGFQRQRKSQEVGKTFSRPMMAMPMDVTMRACGFMWLHLTETGLPGRKVSSSEQGYAAVQMHAVRSACWR